MDRSLKPTFGYLSDLGECGASHLGTGDHGPKTDRSRPRSVPVNALSRHQRPNCRQPFPYKIREELPVIQEESGESITNEPRADLSILIDCAGCPRVLAEAHYPQPGVDAASGSAAVPGSVAQI